MKFGDLFWPPDGGPESRGRCDGCGRDPLTTRAYGPDGAELCVECAIRRHNAEHGTNAEVPERVED